MSFSFNYWLERWKDRRRGDFRSLGSYGILRAKLILEHYDLTGVLIGSVAKAVWEGTLEKISKENSKDTDVLVLDPLGRSFPKANEGGIDWFMYYDNNPLPSNQQTYLDYSIKLINTYPYGSGLYLLHWSILKKIDQYLSEDRQGYPVKNIRMFKPANPSQLLSIDLPIMDPADLEVNFSLGGPKGKPGRFFPNFIQAGLINCDGEF